MGRINKLTLGILLIAFSALFAAPGAVAAPDQPTNEAMQASGGMTLGSAALVALAGVVIAFGRVDAESETGSERLAAGINGRLCTAVPEEHRYDA